MARALFFCLWQKIIKIGKIMEKTNALKDFNVSLAYSVIKEQVYFFHQAIKECYEKQEEYMRKLLDAITGDLTRDRLYNLVLRLIDPHNGSQSVVAMHASVSCALIEAWCKCHGGIVEALNYDDDLLSLMRYCDELSDSYIHDEIISLYNELGGE